MGHDIVPLGPPRQPLDRDRYHRAPGILRYSYPSLTFHNGKAVITYGASALGDEKILQATYGTSIAALAEKFGCEPDPKRAGRFLAANKVRVLPLNWFYDDS